MEISTKRKMQHSLYKYEVLTAQQLAIIHSYKRKSVYPCIADLNKKGLIGKIDVPAIGRGSKAYHLTGASAKQVAEDFNELGFFREKDWNTAPNGIINTLLANQFFCELIKATKHIPNSGLTDWKGGRTLFQPYIIAGESKLPPKMNGFATFYFEDKVRPIYLNVLTGNESLLVLEDMLVSHRDMIERERPNDFENALFLLLYLGSIGKTALKLWKNRNSERKKSPFLAVANFELLSREGIFSSAWLTPSNKEFISISDMPGLPIKQQLSNSDLIGKKQVIKLQFNTVIQSLEFKGAEKVPIDDDIEIDKEEQSEETGIDWSIG